MLYYNGESKYLVQIDGTGVSDYYKLPQYTFKFSLSLIK